MKISSVGSGTIVQNCTIQMNIKKKLQISFRRLLKGDSPSAKMKEYVGLDSLGLKGRITSHFLNGMNWNNYGEDWVIIHLVPLSVFDLTNERQCALAWNFDNLLPVFTVDKHLVEYNFDFAFEILKKREQTLIVQELAQMAWKELHWRFKYL